MDRKFVIALSSLASSMMLTEAHAVGLGEIKLRTNLNEPLRADIQLLQAKNVSEREVLVSLASKEDFAKAGVERDFLLNSLRFRLDLADPKNPKVVVTTDQPIREPYLNFLVEVQWPSGRLLREYTLLMDLPAFADSGSGGARSLKGTQVPAGQALPPDEGVSEVSGTLPAASKPVAAAKVARAEPAVEQPAIKQPAKAQPAAAGVTVRRATKDEIQAGVASAEAPSSVPAKQAAPAASAETAPQSVAASAQESGKPAAAAAAVPLDGSYGPTQTNDTLWKIAQRVRPAGSLTMHQTMVAIQRLNPGAFSNGNINLLKKGQVLKLPSQEEISSISQAEAVASVDNQAKEWKAKPGQQPPVAGGQLDATGKAAPVAPAVSAPEGQLKLAAPSSSASASGKTTGATGNAEVEALKGQLASGMEELNRFQREHADASSRAKDLDTQIANAEKLMSLQSNELASLQAKLAAEQQAKVDAQAKTDADAKKAADDKAKADATAAQQAATTSQPVAPAAELPAVPSEAAPAASTAAAPAATPPPEAAVPAQAAAPQEAPRPAAAVVEPAAAKPSESAESGESFFSTTVWGILGVIGFLAALFGYRKMAQGREQEAPEFEEDLSDFGTAGADSEESSPVTQAEPAAEAEAVEPAKQPEPVAAVEEAKPELGDVLGEADIYISFGNFDKGESLLKSAIAADPGRADYRLKLLELYKESDNLSSFDEAYKDLIELDDDLANMRAGELRGKISGASSTPFAFGVSSVAAAAGISDDEMDFDLDFDLDGSSAAAEESAPVSLAGSVAEQEPAIAEGFDLDLDFDLPEDKTASADEFNFDDFNLDAVGTDLSVDSSDALTSRHQAVVLDEGSEEPTSKNAVVTLDESEESTAKNPAVDFGDISEDHTSKNPAVSMEVGSEDPTAKNPAIVSVDDLGLDFDLDLDLDSQAEEVSFDVAQPVAVAPAVDSGADHDAAAVLGAVTADAGEVDEELGFLADQDEAATKLDLARAYIDMGDKDGARDILDEVLEEGREEQKREARALLDSIA
ncbi:MAG TPA: FimV/HubP family polar landmark protein [Pseudomonadales bacterium]|nr:FimV/HubP family polar landmark protein [Pseudomonadales bacterium]